MDVLFLVCPSNNEIKGGAPVRVGLVFTCEKMIREILRMTVDDKISSSHVFRDEILEQISKEMERKRSIHKT